MKREPEVEPQHPSPLLFICVCVCVRACVCVRVCPLLVQGTEGRALWRESRDSRRLTVSRRASAVVVLGKKDKGQKANGGRERTIADLHNKDRLRVSEMSISAGASRACVCACVCVGGCV